MLITWARALLKAWPLDELVERYCLVYDWYLVLSGICVLLVFCLLVIISFDDIHSIGVIVL
jgi:hypothetical protein